MWIKILSAVGLAKVIRVAPAPVKVPHRHVDLETVRAVIVNRMHVLRDYSRTVILPVVRAELAAARGRLGSGIKRLLVREPALLDEHAQSRLNAVLAKNKALHTVHEFRSKLQVLWNGTHMSNENLLLHLKEWIAQAEASGIKALQDFAVTLRAYALQPAVIAAR